MQEGVPTQPLDYVSKPSGSDQSGNWLAILALVCGITSLVSFCIWILSLPLAVAAVVSGIIAQSRARRWGVRGRGMALAGLICGLVAVVWNLGVIAFFIYDYTRPAASIPMLPQGFKSRTYYSKPQIAPEVAASVDMTGVYFQGKLEGLRVDRVTPDSHLDRDYGLRVGDEIIQAAGWSFDDGEPLDVAKARALSNTPNNLSLTVVRGGKAFYISPGDPPHELPPGRVTIHAQ